jgi:aldehyde:ferredoxin oxidoreductase
MISPEVLGIPQPMDPLTIKDKPSMLKVFQDLTALCDSSGICLFTTFGIGLNEIAGMYREAVGSDESDEDILLKGERIWNLEKQFNIAAGVEKDTLPPRLLREALPSGPAKGKVSDLYTMLKEYYAARGWTEEGIPTDEKLQELCMK